MWTNSGVFTMSGGVIYGSDAGDLANTAKAAGDVLYAAGTAQYAGAYASYGELGTTDDTIPPGAK
jgi:hypothetical protein